MEDAANTTGPLEIWLAEHLPSELLLTPLPDTLAEEVVDQLKHEADRHWYIDVNRSLEYANRIILIGKARNDSNQMALGLMAKGDALKFLGQVREAWDMLTQAGDLFTAAGNEVGWARTRIGRLYLSPNLNCVSEALADAEHAHAIFTRHHETDKLLRLEWQTGLVQNYLGNQQRALELFQSAVRQALALGEQGQAYLGNLYTNTGLTYSKLGNFSQALAWYQKAHRLATAAQDVITVAQIEASMAEIALMQGKYQHALILLNGALKRTQGQPYEMALIQYHLVECYLALNRNNDARETAETVIEQFGANFDARFELARTQLFLAQAQAAVGNLLEAETALGEAEAVFSSLGAKSLLATIRMWRGRLALRNGDAMTAYQEAVQAAAIFDADGQELKSATANLLQGQALLSRHDFPSAFSAGQRALRAGMLDLHYAAHVLLGQVAEALNQHHRAEQHYRAALATINRMHRGLTLTLRPDFLEDKGEAGRRLIALQLRLGRPAQAFETLEHMRAQNWLTYLTNREQLRWSQEDADSRALIAELETLRAEHQRFYALVHRPPDSSSPTQAPTSGQARAEMTQRERRMRAITEQLYLRTGMAQTSVATSPSLRDIQHVLDPDTTLIAYYSTDTSLLAFVVTREGVQANPLPVTTTELVDLVHQVNGNIGGALNLDPADPKLHLQTRLLQRVLGRLHTCLLTPLNIKRTNRRLVIVPYGALHFLPFHLLHNGRGYLVENHEVVIVPTAGLITRPAPKRAPGALTLAHSWDGRLPHTATEAHLVHKLFGGQTHLEAEATRTAFHASPVQVLHIAAHGRHRLDQPDLSYVQLADVQLYANDVLQQDLSYELVTLSACETWQARVAASEDLIGIGRSFLYAGAGALVSSLWQVNDQTTLSLMSRFYAALHAGASKAAALRQAQTSILAEHNDLHPAFWGAFQLVGDAGPLSR